MEAVKRVERCTRHPPLSPSSSIRLPTSADADKIDCSLKEGVLSVHVPKKAAAAERAREVEVK